jgi:dTDP-4-amino-4,6-dideoxygalactose transaminase
VLDHGRILLGPEVDEFERRLAAYCGTKHAVGVGSGSIAIFIALRALGIGQSDEVIVPALSFVGTANGIALAGAKPVFVDVKPDLTIDPALVEDAVTPRTKAIMPVHFTGKVCAMEELAEVAAKHGLLVVEDAAPAIGATRNGRRAGSFGAAACLSINPMKLLNALGEAGAVLTDDDKVRDNVIALRYNGIVKGEHCIFISTNGRLDTVQAAILLERLKGLEGVIERRRKIATFYQDRLSGCVQVPREAPGARDVYYTFTIQCDRRDELAAHLARQGIETKVQHSLLMSQHSPYAFQNRSGRYPVAELATQRILCLPAHENMSEEQAESTAARVLEFYGRRS